MTSAMTSARRRFVGGSEALRRVALGSLREFGYLKIIDGVKKMETREFVAESAKSEPSRRNQPLPDHRNQHMSLG